MKMHKEQANLAQYRYLKLKRQVNPHFLFNSLNILDCLVCDEKTEEASMYIHKLAGIYRYMIKSEEEEVVSLRDELVFVRLYIDLLKVRFPEGFEVEINVDEDRLARFVPPCSIQLLIENATKHNAVSAENPLVVKVETKGDCVQVSNNIVPKVTQSASTGLGQKYISQLYADLSGRNVDIMKTETEYCVILPLL
jgi:LytS/YehU family sensor histidine kinase